MSAIRQLWRKLLFHISFPSFWNIFLPLMISTYKKYERKKTGINTRKNQYPLMRDILDELNEPNLAVILKDSPLRTLPTKELTESNIWESQIRPHNPYISHHLTGENIYIHRRAPRIEPYIPQRWYFTPASHNLKETRATPYHKNEFFTNTPNECISIFWSNSNSKQKHIWLDRRTESKKICIATQGSTIFLFQENILSHPEFKDLRSNEK